MKKQVYTGATLTGTTDYWGSAQYQNGTLDFAMTPEGRTYNASGTFKYDYFIKDHLGNVRACFTHNGSAAQLLQVDDYYPHGNTFGSLVPSGRNNYLFNSKEFQPEHTFNPFASLAVAFLRKRDFHARMYDPKIGRTWQLDPLAGMYAGLSPFSFLANNPVRYIDPTGMSVDDFDIAYSATGSATANAIYGGGWFSSGGGFSSVSTKGGGLNGLVYNWQTGQYTLNGQTVSNADAMAFINTNSKFQDAVVVFNDYYTQSHGKNVGALFSGMGAHMIQLGELNSQSVMQAGIFGDVTFGLISIANFGASANNEMKAYLTMKQNLEMLRELKYIRSVSPIYRKGKQAELLSKVIQGNKAAEALNLASQRLALVGLITGGIEATYKGTAEGWGWFAADAAMTAVGMTGWGAPVAGFYFGLRFIQGLVEMKEGN